MGGTNWIPSWKWRISLELGPRSFSLLVSYANFCGSLEAFPVAILTKPAKRMDAGGDEPFMSCIASQALFNERSCSEGWSRRGRERCYKGDGGPFFFYGKVVDFWWLHAPIVLFKDADVSKFLSSGVSQRSQIRWWFLFFIQSGFWAMILFDRTRASYGYSTLWNFTSRKKADRDSVSKTQRNGFLFSRRAQEEV